MAPPSTFMFAMVPREVLNHPTLSYTAKIAYAVILGFSYADGRCVETNARIGEEMGGRPPLMVGRDVSELDKAGMVTVEYGATRNRRVSINPLILVATVDKSNRAVPSIPRVIPESMTPNVQSYPGVSLSHTQEYDSVIPDSMTQSYPGVSLSPAPYKERARKKSLRVEEREEDRYTDAGEPVQVANGFEAEYRLANLVAEKYAEGSDSINLDWYRAEVRRFLGEGHSEDTIERVILSARSKANTPRGLFGLLVPMLGSELRRSQEAAAFAALPLQPLSARPASATRGRDMAQEIADKIQPHRDYFAKRIAARAAGEIE